MKIDVFASAGEVVKAFNGIRQRIGVDSALLRQLRQSVSSLQIAGTQPGGGSERERSGVARAVATQRATIGQQRAFGVSPAGVAASRAAIKS